MVLHVLRALFILLMAAIGWFFLRITWLSVAISLALGVFFVCIDMLAPRRKLVVFSGTLFGLAVGLAISYALSFAVRWGYDLMYRRPPEAGSAVPVEVQFIQLLLTVVACYFCISFVLQTKDDFRFIIPYVEFSKNTRGVRPWILDTSVLIDGRIADLVPTGFIDSQLIVPRFVLLELQSIADSGDRLKRTRGRRGLDILAKVRDSGTELVMYEAHVRERPQASVDEKLIDLARELNARLLTNDYNLNKAGQLQGVDIINLNDLASALKPVLLPGEKMSVRIVKPGEAAHQGVGYLPDGTMVVVEQGRRHINDEIDIVVTSALQTSAGRMIFGRLLNDESTAAAPERQVIAE